MNDDEKKTVSTEDKVKLEKEAWAWLEKRVKGGLSVYEINQELQTIEPELAQIAYRLLLDDLLKEYQKVNRKLEHKKSVNLLYNPKRKK